MYFIADYRVNGNWPVRLIPGCVNTYEAYYPSKRLSTVQLRDTVDGTLIDVSTSVRSV